MAVAHRDPLLEGITTPMKIGVMPIDRTMLQDLLCLPKSYEILAVTYDKESQLLKFLVTSEELHEVTTGDVLQNVYLHLINELLPEDGSFYRRTAEMHIETWNGE